MQKAIHFLPLVFTLASASFAANNFEVFPSEVNLKFLRDRQSLVCRFTEPNGVHRNVTAQAKMILADPAKARIDSGTVYPVADGQTVEKLSDCPFGCQLVEEQVFPVRCDDLAFARRL